ncbi:MAG: peptidylprolyl isomerase [Trueperaceae bacterium]
MRHVAHVRPLAILLAAVLLAATAGSALAQRDAADPVVLRLGSYTETLSEFEQRFETAMRGVAAQQGAELDDALRAELMPFAPTYLEQRAQEVTLLVAAERRGLGADAATVEANLDEIRANFDSDEAFQDGIRQAGIDTVDELRIKIQEAESIDALYQALEADVSIGEQELRVAYLADRESFQTGEQLCARHILLEDEATAEAVLAEIEDGTPFPEAAREHTTDPSGVESGGDLGCFERGRMVPGFENAVFAAEVGVPTGPVETDFGHHLILVSERQEARTLPLADVEDELRTQMVQERVSAQVERIFSLSGVVTYPERLPVPTPPATEPDATDDGDTDDGDTDDGDTDDGDTDDGASDAD